MTDSNGTTSIRQRLSLRRPKSASSNRVTERQHWGMDGNHRQRTGSSSCVSPFGSPASSASSWIKKTISAGRTPSLPNQSSLIGATGNQSTKKKYSFFKKFQSRKSSAPIIKIQNTSPDASSSQESIPTLPPVGNICPYFENGDHSYCPDCEDNNKYQQQPCCDGVNCYRSSQYSEVNSLLNNLNRLTSCNCDECHQLWFDGSVVNSKLQSHHRIHQINANSSTSAKAIQDPMTDEQVIMELRRRSRHRGHQIVGYRRKLMQQTAEMNKIRLEHKKQLDDIASQLLLFEASLTSRQKALADTLNHKDQVIRKQQKVIRHLLHKKGASVDQTFLENLISISNEPQTDMTEILVTDTTIQTQEKNVVNTSKGKPNVDSDTLARQKRLLQQNWSSIKSDPDFQAATDTDSAIMLEDHIAEISVSVPNLGDIKSPCSINVSTCDPEYENVATQGVKVIRSVSDVIALNIEKVDTNCKDFLSLDSNSSNTANPPKIYTSIEQQNRRNSAESSAAHKTRQNRLLLLKKRHSGFHLRRPEILETVYSVEEDTEGQGGQQITAIASSSLKDSVIECSESSSAPPSATISMVATTTTVTAGVIPLTTSTNITLTGFRWTDSLNKEKKGVPESIASNNILPQSPSIVSRIKQLYAQQESARKDEEDRRLSLISNEKYDRDETGRCFMYSSGDDTESLATTTSATGSRRSSYGSRRSSYGLGGMTSGPYMCSMNDLDWRRDSLVSHGIENGEAPQGGGCGNDNLVCQCFQCAAVNATKAEAASVGKGNTNISSLEPSKRITCGRVCASAPTSRRASAELLKKSMISNCGTFNPPKPPSQVHDDLNHTTKQPESTCTSTDVSKDRSSNAINISSNSCSTHNLDNKQERNSIQAAIKDSKSSEEQKEMPNNCNVSSVKLMNSDTHKEKCSVEGLKTKVLISNYEVNDSLRDPTKTSNHSVDNKEYRNKCVIQINDMEELTSDSERKNVPMALPDIIDDIQTNKSLAKTKDGNEVNVENKSTLSIHKEPTKPKDIKFKRISKAKSRSLEELRDQLRWQQILSEGEMCSIEDKNIIDGQYFEKASESEIEGIISNKTRNRLTALREYLRQYGNGVVGLHQRSLDSHPQLPTSFDNSDYAACNDEKHTYID